MPVSVYTKHRRLVSQIRELLDEIDETLDASVRGRSRRASIRLAECESRLQETVRSLLLANVALRAVGSVDVVVER